MRAKNLTLKILTIVASAIILLSFFLPWLSFWGMQGSAAEIIAKIAESLEHIHNFDEDNFYILLPFLLLAMPICSVIMIIMQSVSKNARALRFPKILMAIVMTLFIGFLIYLENETGGNGYVFSTLASGFYFTIIHVIYLFVSVFFKSNTGGTQPSVKTYTPPTPQSFIFCTNCGTKYDTSHAGKFCSSCGTKL